jgi:hypothetical protein
MHFSSLRLAVAVLAVSVGAGSASAATCSNATLKGVYGLLSSGLDGSGQPATSVAQITADGAGNITGAVTKSKDGTIYNYTTTGTYSMAKNCTGSATYTNQDGSPRHDNFVMDDANKGLQAVQTDSGHVQSAFVLPEGTVTCGLTGKKATFAFNLTGTVVGTGQAAYVGQVTLDGTGKVSGSMTASIAGSIGTASITGTYTEASSCTGTMQISASGYPSSNYNFVVVNAGKELLLIETDPNTVTSGTLQQ